jgi:uncharacterized protein YfaS (alpha-2-macroglobulin family)
MRTWLILLGTVLAVQLQLQAGVRDAQWKKVDEAINQGLPKSAIEALEPIIQGATKDKAWGEVAKAVCRKIVLEANIQGNKPEEKITRLQAEIAKAPGELKPVYHAIQATWYWHYFIQNRWRFMQRTATAAEPGNDFTTWDLPRLFAEIDKEFTAALAAADTLKKMPVSQFDDLLVKGSVPDKYRPTMYDFLAHEALQFYTSGEQAAAKPQDAFEIPATSPILDGLAAFLAWKPETTDTESPKLKAIRLYQDLLRFHQPDSDPTALLDVDLARLHYGYNTAFGDEKRARYRAALKAFVDQWTDHELAAMALHQWALVVREEGDWVEAHRLASRGAKVYPKSAGGLMCRNLVREIESRELSLNTERVWNAPWPKIRVQYRNITEVHFRLVAWDWDATFQKRGRRPEWLDDAGRKEVLKRAPAQAWTAKLPPTTDYQGRVESVAAPENLKPGFYYLLASAKADFSDQDNVVHFTDIWVSDLALVPRTFNGMVQGFVLEALTGEPVANAEVRSWHWDNQGNRVANAPVRTDENGFFVLDVPSQRGYLLHVRHQGRELASQNEYWASPPVRRRPASQTLFFTDRALYRPGQTISFKGICLQVDQEQDKYELLPGQKLTVVFADPNGKEIERREVRANDFGSFSGSFTAPRDRVTGRMRIFVQGGPNGSASVSVEEYKRPKFQVSLDAPKTAARLNDRVELGGKAESYTGAAVDNALVKYRVVREVRYPIWWRWYYWWDPAPGSGAQEIAHGSTRTGTDGTFKVEFVAKPDLSISPTNEPTFHYTIYADVTDNTGETRSAQRAVMVGYTALQASLSAEEWLTSEKPVAIALYTTTLDGEGQAAEGSLKIYQLEQPATVIRPELTPPYYPRRRGGGLEGGADKPGPTADPNTWPLGKVVAERGLTTSTNGRQTASFNLAPGVYRAIFETQDRFGKPVKAMLPLRVLDPAAEKLNLKIPSLLAAPKWQCEPGEEFMALWGTGYDTGRAYIEIEHRGKMIQKYWTRPGRTQEQIKQAVNESMRGGFTLHVTQVRENRAYLESRWVEVPWSNKQLGVKWERLVSKLMPGQKETWSLVVTGPNAQKAAAEMVAALYDESLDAYLKHNWMRRFNVFRMDHSQLSRQFENTLKHLNHLYGGWREEYVGVDWRYRSFPPDLTQNLWGYQYFFGGRGGRAMMARRGVEMEMADAAPMAAMAAPAPPAPGMAGENAALRQTGAAMEMAKAEKQSDRGQSEERKSAGRDEGGGAAPDLSKVSPRKNLNETAFFFPQLIADKDGVVRLEFTMPEALTTWRFLGFAHDKELRSGFIEEKVVTAKDLMVQPNPPRFLREGDTLEFTVKISNQSTERQTGKVVLSFREAATDQPADKKLGNTRNELAFDIPPKESRTYAWRLSVPDGLGFLIYKAVASTGKLADGEEGHLPVLSRRIYVTESLPLPIRGPGTKKFEFTKLVKNRSSTLQHQGFTVQMVSQPAWYAVMALPYLMEYPYECSEQIFNRYYANTLARHIANSDPKIRRIFDQWKNTPALDSPLEKNLELKSVLLEETPWYRDAQNESQARRNVGILFDDNRLNYELNRALQKLGEMQMNDGRWPWFPGGPGDDYITLYIVTGFGRLRHLGCDLKVDPALKALGRLDEWMDERHREILRVMKNPDAYVPSALDALYLYGRSFFLKDKAVAKEHQDAVQFFLKQSRQHWLKLANRQSQAHLAIAMKRWGGAENGDTALAIMRSIKERSVSNEEMGMFWRDLELSWWWFHAPIETQAMMIEAFDEVMNDARAVEDCKVWLLKQKQTQNWKTTKATADAVYGLLLRGNNLLSSDALVEVSVGGLTIKPEKVEAGTGFYEKRFSGAEVKAKMGQITVKKTDPGVSWGSVHWQYLEDMSKVTPYEGTPLKLKKTLYVKTHTKKGPVLEPVKGPINVGDELVVRIELRVDRDMEYVHLKDQRGSGVEPVNVLSRYRYQDGLGYYESTRDTASHFFISYLPKGVYVFEYSTRVQHRGTYQTGMASIQCMYAPEFNSHSESFNLVVK